MERYLNVKNPPPSFRKDTAQKQLNELNYFEASDVKPEITTRLPSFSLKISLYFILLKPALNMSGLI